MNIYSDEIHALMDAFISDLLILGMILLPALIVTILIVSIVFFIGYYIFHAIR